MPYEKAIHKEHHIPMPTNRLVITNLILVESQVMK
jgi:hypothetical protein